MPYVIRYFLAGQTQVSTVFADSFASAKKIAAVGVQRHGIDHAEITDHSGKVIWWRVERGSASPATRRGTPFLSALRKVGRMTGLR